MRKEKSAGAVVFRKEGRKIYYLLLHYEAGHWDFPKGHIEKGESEKDTARREIKEETGIEDIEFIPGFKEKISYFFRKSYENKKNPPLVYKEVVFFLAKTNTKDIKLSFEHKGFLWLEYEKAKKRLTFENTKKILEKAHQFLMSLKS